MRVVAVVVSTLVLVACESGTGRSVKLTLPDAVVQSASVTAPALVVSDLGGSVAAYLVLCGTRPKDPVYLSQDLGFGCLGALNGTTETVRVWVEPLPASLDAAAICAQQHDRSLYEALSLGSPDGGAVLAATPDAAWAQGSAQGTWRRDLSPCGGVVNFEVALAVP